MKFNWMKAIITFVIGFIISISIGVLFNDDELASMTAICYVGALIVGMFSKKED